MGVLANDSGSFAIPAGVDLAQYPIVDISDQPYNGDPAHSADSIVRGKPNPKAEPLPRSCALPLLCTTDPDYDNQPGSSTVR
ncbi:hypothetical protein [Arthrobacter bambusae]|uniref:hypothetical protein n=1 Tax=Arthrobacter bambusae TaxID=1338426 RepID=UPI002789B98D|nr:hypothetical protein [Arthrobacter bambusae]MDQ0028612.1 hypothetical protein [Arthrobacter bambusae]MDQ0096594.1 hypothetical protein [Arthrobacter bambusae]